MSHRSGMHLDPHPEAPDRVKTLVDLLRLRASGDPDRLAYTFLVDGEAQEVALTYGELDRQARLIGASLRQRGAHGERVLLLYPPGLDFIAAFFGCLYAGAVAVPAYPPRLNRNLDRLQAIVADAQSKIALTTASTIARLRSLQPQAPELQALSWMTNEDALEGAEGDWREPEISGDSLAFLQYTSGSTGTPKGVMASHRNLLHNSSLLRYAFDYTPESRCVSWLPLYHDMGLIGGVLQPLYGGFPCTLMAPASFLQKPVRWLQAITNYKATISGGPDFAYNLCARKITPEQQAGLDLSSWIVAFNGAEPIRADTIERFSNAFEACGFRRQYFFPCYGLAEATLIVSGSSVGAQPRVKRVDAAALENNLVVSDFADEGRGRSLVGCGRVLPDEKVVIVNPSTGEESLPGQVGEVWVAGPSVAQGYWNRPEETARTFNARISNTGEGPFMRTGDLGFLDEGELFVTGRLKDLIIIRGVNHYPQDLESSVERCHPALRAAGGAAFSIEYGQEEKLVIVHEVDHHRLDPEPVIASIREAVSAEHEMQVFAVALIQTGSLPKTSSGKVQRYAARAAYLEDRLKVVGRWQAGGLSGDETPAPPAPPARDPGALQSWLASLVAAKLGLDPYNVDTNQSITQYGIDSMLALELAHQVETALGVSLPLVSFFNGASISQISSQIAGSLETLPLIASPSAGGEGPADEHQLSHGQQALWFLHQLAPESTAYNIVAALRIRSELDADALQNAFQLILQRHACLRTVFAAKDGKPVQRVQPRVDLGLQHRDASLWTDSFLDESLSEEAHRPFDLEQAPLIRVSLFTIRPQEHILLLSVHHIVADFWSLAVMIHELGALYTAQTTGAPANLPELPLEYFDYARWQRRMLAGARGEQLWRYWEKQLGGDLPRLNLPTDRPRPPVQTYEGGSYLFRFSAAKTRGLKSLAQENDATLFMILLAAFNALLHRYTGQEDITVGSLTSGRGSAQLSGLVGYFVNPVVLRPDLSGDPSFEELLVRTRETVLDAFEHQDYPFALLVERLQPDRDPSRSPLFQVMFVLQKAPVLNEEGLASLALGEAGVRMELGEMSLESVALERRVAQFDLMLVMAEVENGLAASLQYNKDLFDAGTILRMAGHFQTLIEGIVDNPRERLSRLPMLTERERRYLLAECNDTEQAYERDSCIHELFAAQAKRTPDRVALVFEGEHLTYGALNRRANQLAHHLKSLGAGPDTLVGICVERSVDMIVGLLGILKSGAAYLPLDPSYPKSRLAFMLEDAKAPLVVTQKRLVLRVPSQEAQVVSIDSDWDTISLQPENDPAGGAGPGNLAYVIYTSGSTGRPKGVMIDHRSVTNFFAGMDKSVGCGEADTLLAVTSISFDISALELFWTMARGARVVLLSERAIAGGPPAQKARARKPMQFSLFYFSSNDSGSPEEKYRLLIEGVKFADQHGFEAVWTPERHFHEFGGLYPNPSVTSAALATITERIKIRAGSVVLPLHNPIRVAEEWALVDNLSRGRVAIAFASGWHSDDFAFMPENYDSRKEVMFDGINVVKKLWRGEPLTVRSGSNKEIDVKIFPKPVQAELPVWITAAGSPDTFARAGEIGANVLTHLLGQSLEEVAERIKLYRQSLSDHGHDPEAGRVTLMLHTFLGGDRDVVREKVREPFTNYLRSSIGLIANMVRSLNLPLDLNNLTPQDMESLLDHAFNRYFETSALFGTTATCAEMIEELKAIGVDETACLIDFGVDTDSALAGLYLLNELKEISNTYVGSVDYSLPAQAERYNATMLQCTPSMMGMLMLNSEVPGSLKSLRALMLGGEALPPALAREVREALPARLINMYGPTETTIWSATHEVEEVGSVVPIGSPISNTQIYVLDGHLQLAPPGIEGELYISGDGVSRGYLGRPALTAERLIPDPFSRVAGSRMYRTGDLSRRLPHGAVEFLGRVDHQAKVRGFRIELEEIEAVLGEAESVREAVVLAREDNPGDVRLVAYVVEKEPRSVSTSELRDFVRDRLPDYMVPAAFVVMEAFPLTSNGKVERKALPAPEGLRLESNADYVPPRSRIEQTIAEVWRRVLKLDRIGVHDNFFDLGGHSLLMAQVHNQLRGELKRELPLVRLLEHTTISSLAKYLAREETKQPSFSQNQSRASKQREGLLRQRRRASQPKQ
ncbi:MAG TPA: MupA/Atu3671 family FMN-dependent luciferase-like monooxygenase [Blastocatellia bacterium]|nr:MupA/Atu3671 family FMN-dependent luciferase-like monooxygenase [Blastocatellia bacterium]